MSCVKIQVIMCSGMLIITPNTITSNSRTNCGMRMAMLPVA
uniref:Uncharacterized protein n=1 Tax=Rhizophora mucronata TaxID=61149 RepID=A0A2P2NG83_RHIMU